MIQAQNLVRCSDGQVSFLSDAALEDIRAQSDELKGIIDTDNRTFAFSVEISSFKGFNSPLQRIHFNENYLESEKYPTANFTGKFIENYDLTVPGTYEIRVKGKLSIHGVEKERILKGSITVTDREIRVTSAFTLLLKEHDIRIPRLVHQKIAELISIEVAATLKRDAS